MALGIDVRAHVHCVAQKGNVVKELEAAAAESLSHAAGGAPGLPPPPGAACLNCGARLQGRYCHVCGQNSDTHKRSVGHLIVESLEGLVHFDSRMLRTLPDLFFRPGRLARDYMEGRIARHVPPFRTFLVALLVFIFAGENAAHRLARQSEHDVQARTVALGTSQGRAKEIARLRIEAATDREADLKEIQALGASHQNAARVAARYDRAVSAIQRRYTVEMAEADRLAAGGAPNANFAAELITVRAAGTESFWKDAIRKAMASPEYYLAVMFAWGHRAAFLLLPIVGLTLAAVYFLRRRFFIYDHLLVAMNFLSFVFLANALGFVLPGPLAGPWLGLVAVWAPVNLFQTLRGAYGSSVLGALAKTVLVWTISFLAFCTLLISLVVFSLTQI
jgi:hypothetical protein